MGRRQIILDEPPDRRPPAAPDYKAVMDRSAERHARRIASDPHYAEIWRILQSTIKGENR